VDRAAGSAQRSCPAASASAAASHVGCVEFSAICLPVVDSASMQSFSYHLVKYRARTGSPNVGYGSRASRTHCSNGSAEPKLPPLQTHSHATGAGGKRHACFLGCSACVRNIFGRAGAVSWLLVLPVSRAGGLSTSHSTVCQPSLHAPCCNGHCSTGENRALFG